MLDFQEYGIGMPLDRIVLSGHNPDWEACYQAVVKELQRKISGLDMCHIGSTSITNIMAKPIIDILGSVDDLQYIDQNISKFEELGYESKGEFGIPGRRFFILADDIASFVHVHIFQKDDDQVARHKFFRDYIGTNVESAEAYVHLKLGLQKKYEFEKENYVDGKDSFIKSILDLRTDVD